MTHASDETFVRPSFGADHPIAPDCPLCWANGRLAGGDVVVESKDFYVYAFRYEDGGLKDCFIAPKDHHLNVFSLPSDWGQRFGEVYEEALQKLGIGEKGQHNVYWNIGERAGQTVSHWHARICKAPEERDPSSNKGLALLRKDYDELFRHMQELQRGADSNDSPAAPNSP